MNQSIHNMRLGTTQCNNRTSLGTTTHSQSLNQASLRLIRGVNNPLFISQNKPQKCNYKSVNKFPKMYYQGIVGFIENKPFLAKSKNGVIYPKQDNNYPYIIRNIDKGGIPL